MTAIPLNLAYQCKWCNEEELWLGHNCRSCGSKIGKCRAPKWERIRATVSSVDNAAYTTQLFLNGTASQCCGTGTSAVNAFNSANGTLWSNNPFRDNGLRCQYRFYQESTTDYSKLCIVDTIPQPRVPLYSITTCQHWVYNLHWHYWSRLNSVQLYLSRLVEDSCRWRVTLRVSGVHLLAHTFQYLDPLPPNNCAGQYFLNGVYIGTKDISIINASSCEPAPCALLPNANCAMPSFLSPIDPTILNLPGEAAFTYWMSKDVDELTTDPISFDRNEDTALEHCGIYATNSSASLPTVTCPTPSSETFPADTTWSGIASCEGCFLQQKYGGGSETVEVNSFAYDFTQAIWDAWNVAFTFV